LEKVSLKNNIIFLVLLFSLLGVLAPSTLAQASTEENVYSVKFQGVSQPFGGQYSQQVEPGITVKLLPPDVKSTVKTPFNANVIFSCYDPQRNACKGEAGIVFLSENPVSSLVKTPKKIILDDSPQIFTVGTWQCDSEGIGKYIAKVNIDIENTLLFGGTYDIDLKENFILHHSFEIYGTAHCIDNNSPETVSSLNANTNAIMPSWFKTNAQWWNDGLITDVDMINALESLIIQDIIPLDNFVKASSGLEHTAGVSPGGTFVDLDDRPKIPNYQKTVFGYWGEGVVSDGEIINSIGHLMSEGIISSKNIKNEIEKRKEILIDKGIGLDTTGYEIRQPEKSIIEIERDEDGRPTDPDARDSIAGTYHIGGSAILGSIFEIAKQNELTMTYLQKIKSAEYEIASEACGIALKDYTENQNQYSMNNMNTLCNAEKTAKQELELTTQIHKTSVQLVENAKNDAVKSGLHVLDLEESVIEQQSEIDSTDKKLETESEIESASEDAKKSLGEKWDLNEKGELVIFLVDIISRENGELEFLKWYDRAMGPSDTFPRPYPSPSDDSQSSEEESSSILIFSEPGETGDVFVQPFSEEAYDETAEYHHIDVKLPDGSTITVIQKTGKSTFSNILDPDIIQGNHMIDGSCPDCGTDHGQIFDGATCTLCGYGTVYDDFEVVFFGDSGEGTTSFDGKVWIQGDAPVGSTVDVFVSNEDGEVAQTTVTVDDSGILDVNFEGLENGEYFAEIQILDESGNLAFPTEAIEFDVDQFGFEVVFFGDSGEGTTSFDGKVWIQGEAPVGSTVDVFVSNIEGDVEKTTAVIDSSGSLDVYFDDLVTGEYLIEIQILDESGNLAFPTEVIEFDVGTMFGDCQVCGSYVGRDADHACDACGSELELDPSDDCPICGEDMETMDECDDCGYGHEESSSNTVDNPDGSVTTTYDDGSSATTYPDGKHVTTFPDGTTIISYPDGTSTKIFSDGTFVNFDQNGNEIHPETNSDDKTRTTNSDGTVTIIYPDGTNVWLTNGGSKATITYPDGSIERTSTGFYFTGGAYIKIGTNTWNFSTIQEAYAAVEGVVEEYLSSDTTVSGPYDPNQSHSLPVVTADYGRQFPAYQLIIVQYSNTCNGEKHYISNGVTMGATTLELTGHMPVGNCGFGTVSNYPIQDTLVGGSILNAYLNHVGLNSFPPVPEDTSGQNTGSSEEDDSDYYEEPEPSTSISVN
jgi:hypothetical protein